ncbi:MAG: L,D-transpeptidase family protein [Acidimicrobiia bacterium]|nr:L,D-transpeptidase family protein [Acidimicrobiia bacterium]
MSRPGQTPILALTITLLLSACGTAATAPTEPDSLPPDTTIARIGTASTEAPPAVPPDELDPSDPPETPTTVPSPPDSIAGLTSGEIAVFAAIGDDEPFRILPEKTILGTPTVVSIIGEFPGWVHALLPGRPNGQTGWIRAADVDVFTLEREVLVDLDVRRLTVLSDGEQVFESDVAVGSEVSPTPTGVFFVTDAVQLTSPNGPWGPYAFGLSARSDVVTEFNGGDGIVGIHGTNQPWSIGEAASLGCVRLPNDVIEILWDIMAVGMKVTITGSGST